MSFASQNTNGKWLIPARSHHFTFSKCLSVHDSAAISVISRVPSAHLSSPRNQEPLCQSVLSAPFVVRSPKSIQNVKKKKKTCNLPQGEIGVGRLIRICYWSLKCRNWIMERQDFCGGGRVCAACGEAEGWLRSSPPHTRPISFNQAERRAALSSGRLSSLSARSASVTCTCAPLRIITWIQPPCRTAEELSRAALQHTLVALYILNTPIDLPSK